MLIELNTSFEPTHLNILQGEILRIRATVHAELGLDASHHSEQLAHSSHHSVHIDVCVIATQKKVKDVGA